MSIKSKSFQTLTAAMLVLAANLSYAGVVKIGPNTVIGASRIYDGVTLDMSRGNFIVKDKATLTIKNSVVMGTLSKSNPVLVNIENGQLSMVNNDVKIETDKLQPHPLTQSLENVIMLGQGNVNLSDNMFKIDQAYTAGLLITSASVPTVGNTIINNKFEKFHGVLYLVASDNAKVSKNTFLANSYGHIVMIGNNSKITQNTIFFSGNNRLGNAIDVIDSSNIVIRKNHLFTPTCHGIYVLNSHDLDINNNRISGGITYAMNVFSYPETMKKDDEYLKSIISAHKMKNTVSHNITIANNFMSQNRFGIAVSDTNDVVVKNNVFIQRFADNEARVFWTNNAVLFQNVTNVTWTNNLYKEAYTQVVGGDNSKSNQFVVFPQTGGVSL